MEDTNFENNQPLDSQSPQQPVVKKKKQHKILKTIFFVFLLAIAFCGGTLFGISKAVSGIYGSSGSIKKSEGSTESGEVDMDHVKSKLNTLEQYIDKLYLYDVSAEDLENGIYYGFMNALGDPYSCYYTEEEYKSLTEEDSGEYKGIGVTVIQNQTNLCTEIVTVNKGDPAYNAGMKVGDLISEVNGKDATKMTLTEVVKEIKTSPDPVHLKVYRGAEQLEFDVNKSTITINSVEYRMDDNKIGYISVSQFIENTDEQFVDAIDQLTNQGMKGLVIDLRDNGGGMVDSCVNMVSRIIPKGDLVAYTETKDGSRSDYNSNSAKTVDVPIVILVNGNSASASELFTGCLKDYGKATVLGTKTFGKGIVQYIMPLGDGSAIKTTVSSYYTPNGVCIHGTGIEPDVKMEISDEEWKEASADPTKDEQLKRAEELLTNN